MKNSKKIALLSFYSGHLERGVETWARGLSEHISDHEIRIFGYKGHLNFKKIDSSGILLSRFFIDYKSLKILIFTFQILPEIDKYNPDIIIPTNGGWQSLIIRLYSWLFGKKVVIVGQSGIGWDDYFNLATLPDCFVALTQRAAIKSKKFIPFVSIKKIPNAVDTQLFKPLNRKKHNKKKLVLSVGALEKGKRMDKIVSAISKLKNVKLKIIGKGSEKNNLQKLAKKLNVEMEISSVSHEEIHKEYQKADLFVSASKSYYAFEIVIIEALSTNLPVVANKDEIRQEIVGKAGYLGDPEDSEGFSRLINKALRENWREKPRQQAEKFSWQSVSDKYTKLFNNL